MEESKELKTETESRPSSAEPESEASPSLSFLFDNGYIHEKNHLIEGIKSFLSMSKILKMKERENCLLRNQIEALKIEKEEVNKGGDTHQNLAKQKLLESVIEELKNLLEIHHHNHEVMQARLEELEYQKKQLETNSARMERTIQNLKSNFELSKLERTNGKDSGGKEWKMESPERLKVSGGLQSSQKVQSREKNAGDILQTESNSSIDLNPLPSETIQTSSDGEAMKTDSSRSSSSNSKSNSTDDNHQVEMEIKKLIEIMDRLSQNRRISALPSSLQSEPSVIYQSSETFVRITDVLKTILAGKHVPYRSVQSFWDFLIHQGDTVEKVIREKSTEIRRLAGNELNRMEKEYLIEKEKVSEELNEAAELAQDRLFLLTELTDKHENALKEKDDKIVLLESENNKLNVEIAEYKVAMAASLQASRSMRAAEMTPKVCQPSVMKCDHEDYRQQLENLKVSSRKTEKELKHKLILAEKKLDLEKQKQHLKMSSKPDSQPDTIIEAAPLKEVRNVVPWYKPRVYAYANAGRGEMDHDADKEDEFFQSFSSRKDPEDKDWLISRFLKTKRYDS